MNSNLMVPGELAAEQVQTDVLPSVPRRNRASAKKAGSSFERLVADYLAAVVDDRIDRRVKTGAKDRGDIAGVRTIRGARVVIEVKNVARMDLSGWVREAETEAGNDDAAVFAVAHKRRGKADPGEQFVTMPLSVFASLLLGGPDFGDAA